MQNMTEKNHPMFNDIHHMAKKNFESKIISRDCDCNNCGKRCSNQYNFSEIHSQHNKVPNPYDLIKPCYVQLRRLNLWGHDGNKISNCCPTLSEMKDSKESVVNKRSDKFEHDNYMTINRNLNLSEKNRDSVKKQMDLLFETLCQTFRLIKAKKRKYKKAKKVDLDVVLSYSAEKQRKANDSSTELIDDLYQGKNQRTKICKIIYLSDFKNTEEKSDKKQFFKENIQHSYEGNDNENEFPSHKDINNMHIRDAFSNEIYSDLKNKYCKIRKIDPKCNCNVPLVNSTTKILSRFSAESENDKIIQANVLHFPLKNNIYNVSSPKAKRNGKFENAFDRNNEVNIEMQEKHAVQKNLKGAKKNYLVDKGFFNEKSVCLSNLNIKSIRKADIVLEDSDPEVEILEECTDERNLNETTKKYEDDISALRRKVNSHTNDCNKCVENADSVETNKYNIPSTILKDVSNSNILHKQTKSCGHSADNSISFTKINKIPNKSTISEFIVGGEQILSEGSKKIKEIIPLIKPCYVALYKLPIDKKMGFIGPTVMNSFCHENASSSVVRDNNRSSISEAKKVRQRNKRFCSASSNLTVSSTKFDEIVNIDDDNVSAINETISFDEIPKVDDVSAINGTINVDEIPNVDDDSAVNGTIKIDEIPNENISAVNETIKVPLKENHLTIMPCSVILEDIRHELCRRKRAKRRKKLALRQKRARKKLLLERHEYVRQWLLKIEECEENPQLMEDMNENFCRNSNKLSVLRENQLICNTPSDTLSNYPLDSFKIVDCYVSLERINVDEYLMKNKNTFKQHDLKNPSEDLVRSEPDIVEKYEIDENSVSDSSLKRKSSSIVMDISELIVKKPKKMVENGTIEKTLKNNETVDNHINIICHSDYKCVQCHLPIPSDYELYHHLCRGKRKKGYICDFCEKIFVTVLGLQKHMNYHYKFIS